MYDSYNYNLMKNNFSRNNYVTDSNYFRESNNNSFDLYGNGLINGINMNNTSSNTDNSKMMLSTPTEGYTRGNLFSNLYSEYKNYTPRNLTTNDPRVKLWLEMSENYFAAHEINLYLDLNPEDSSMISLFNDYRNKAESLKEEYESMYGPISLSSDTLDNTPFLWENKSFPWEGGNN